MTVDRPASSPPEFICILTQAACAFRDQNGDRPLAPNVVAALLKAEKVAKRERLNYRIDDLLGTWRLCFTANKKAHYQGDKIVGKGAYVPRFVPAQISFDVAAAELSQIAIGNQVRVGWLTLKLTGPARYSGKKNLLAFDFTQMQLAVGNRSLYRGNIRGGAAQAKAFDNRPIGELPFFAFFLVTPDLIAARGRGGGLALWVRELELGEPWATGGKTN